MSCEIICCEVPHVLNAVAKENDDTAALTKLFSMLDDQGDMDAYRAGYLEKVRLLLFVPGRPRCYCRYRQHGLGQGEKAPKGGRLLNQELTAL